MPPREELDPPGAPASDARTWRRTLVAAWFAQMSAIVGFSFVMPFLRFYLRDELGVTDDLARAKWTTAIIAAPTLVMAVAAPLWGALADRIGRKVMVMRAMFGGAVVIGLMGLVTGPVQLLVLRLAQGLLTGTMTAFAALVAGVSPARRAGFSMGMMQAAIFTGNAAGFLMGGEVAVNFGRRTSFVIAAGFLLAGGVVAALFASEGRWHPRQAREDGRHGIDHTLWDVVRNPAFLTIVALIFVMHSSRAFPGPVFQEYVELIAPDKSAADAVFGRTWAVMFALAAVTSVLVGRMADRVGHTPLVIAGTLAAGLLCIPQTWIQSTWQLYLVRGAVGVAMGTIGPAMGHFVHSAIPRTSHGKAFGLVQSAGSAARGIGMAAGGGLNWALIPIYGAELALRIPFLVAGVFQVMAGLAAWALFAKRRAARARAGPSPGPAPATGSADPSE